MYPGNDNAPSVYSDLGDPRRKPFLVMSEGLSDMFHENSSFGATHRTRTDDLFITNELLYQLS